MNYEKANKTLEDIIEKIENPNTPLDVGVELFEQGVEAAKVCLDILNECQGKITVIKDKINKLNCGNTDE